MFREAALRRVASRGTSHHALARASHPARPCGVSDRNFAGETARVREKERHRLDAGLEAVCKRPTEFWVRCRLITPVMSVDFLSSADINGLCFFAYADPKFGLRGPLLPRLPSQRGARRAQGLVATPPP